MLRRALPALLLLSFAFWATGLARFVHEELEHHPRPVLAYSADGHWVTADGELPHDECPTCQTLAAMSVARTVPPPAPTPAVEPPPRSVVLPADAPRATTDVTRLPPARGPPART